MSILTPINTYVARDKQAAINSGRFAIKRNSEEKISQI